MTVRGSPGSGKSTLLRLVQTETLVGLKSLSSTQANQLVEQLTDLGAFTRGKLSAIGIYVLCDSNLRDIFHQKSGGTLNLLNTLLDNRIILAFLRNIDRARDAGVLNADVTESDLLRALSAESMPPPLFASARSVSSLRAECEKIEAAFADLLNSFPDDPLPATIRPHLRLFALEFIARQTEQGGIFEGLKPIFLLDDFQDLYEDQRAHLSGEMLRRVGVPRWVATRKHIYPLEELLSVQGTQDGRDVRELDLDDLEGSAFKRFANDVASRRIQLSVPLYESGVSDLAEMLDEDGDQLANSAIRRGLADAEAKIERLGLDFRTPASSTEDVGRQRLIDAEAQLILAERLAARRQQSLFSSELAEDADKEAKLQSAAELFAAKKHKIPYFYSSARIFEAANSNIEQFLGIGSALADKLIFRAELNRSVKLGAAEQEAILKAHAEAYYERIPRAFPSGSAIRQLVDNVARIFVAITFRPTAPIAPGVTGVGVPRSDLENFVQLKSAKEDVQLLRTTLTMAVANGVFRVRAIKQGSPGRDNVVLYLNRLLCIKYALPLSYGGWRPVRADQLVRMIGGNLSNDELLKIAPTALLDEDVAL